MAYPLADMVGHVSWLQMGLLRSSVVLIMLIICSSRRYCSTTSHMIISMYDGRCATCSLPWCAIHSPSSTSFGFAAKVMKLPLTMRPEYSSRKKKGGRREAGAELSGGASKDMAEERAGEWGIGGTFGGCPDVAEGEYGELAVGEGVPLPLPG